MNTWLERFALTILAAILGATVLTNPWNLDRVQKATLIVAIIALSLFAARTVEKARDTRGTPEPTITAGAPSVPQPGPSNGLPTTTQTKQPVDRAAAAERAAEHYRRTSPKLKREEIRAAYKDYCDRIAAQLGLDAWAPVNQLTRMVTTNMGDSDAFARAEKEVPNGAWAAIRVLVAFETAKERPMYTSYVFVGRAPGGEELVALFDVSQEWRILSSSQDPETDHQQLIVDTLKTQLRDLGDRIAGDIRRLG